MQSKYKNLIFKNILMPLSSVSFHENINCIERYFSKEFPMHLAIHKVDAAEDDTRNYTKPHIHIEDEINIIIGQEGEMEYAIQLGSEMFSVETNASIWIPGGLLHSANVIRGKGYFIAIYLNKKSIPMSAFINEAKEAQEKLQMVTR